MHAVRPVARCNTLCVKALQSTVEHVPRLSIMRREETMLSVSEKADARIF